MDTYVEPEIEEVQGPMDEDDIMMDACGCHENISLHGKLCASRCQRLQTYLNIF